MPTIGRSGWTRQQLLVAFALYCRIPFGRMHAKNPEIVRIANAIDRTPSALAMKLVNIASLDPEITGTGRSGLKNASTNDRAMWDEMQDNWDRFAVESDLATRGFEAIAEPLDGEVPGDDSGFPVGEDRAVHTTVRIGQDFFRAAVLSAYSGQCCITGLSMPKLLVASHIVPWRIDRLNRGESQKRSAVVCVTRQSVRHRFDYDRRQHDRPGFPETPRAKQQVLFGFY